MRQQAWCGRYVNALTWVMLMLIGLPVVADEQSLQRVVPAPSFEAWSQPQSSQVQPSQVQPRAVALLETARRPWRLCAILPNLRDGYWSLVRYGLEQQATRLGVELTLIEAAGYDAVEQQISLIHKRCIGGGQDALLLAAVDHSAINNAVRAARHANLPVIDLINGISAPEVSARVAVDYGTLAYLLGRHMVDHARGRQVVLAPGPEGSAWAQAADEGFRRALAGTSLTAVHRYFAAPFVRDQRRKLVAIAQEQPLELVAGTAVTAEAAASLKEENGNGPEIFSYYYNPNLHVLLRCGQVRAALYEYPAQQGRVAIDQAVRILEQQPFDFRLAVKPVMLSADNVDQLLTPLHLPAALIEQLTRRRCVPERG